ncbi:MAG TPA: hypothetical protein PLL33_00585 [Paracoccus sp. (in: a-proteobacteria)]|nr:hypothetical protein [Paracoccus sp. (in: a-proteobacteria)]
MSTFALVERKIGRSLEDCIDVKAGSDTIGVHLDRFNREVEVWTPSFEQYCDIAVEVVNQYRIPRSFEVGAHELWPYVDTYQFLYLDQLAGIGDEDALWAIDQSYRAGLINTSTETVYARAREALSFSDGVQVLDPFVTLMGSSVGDSWAEINDPAYFKMTFPPATLLRSTLFAGDRWQGNDYRMIWAACVEEALNIKPLVHAGYVRLTSGAQLWFWNFHRLFADIERREVLLKALQEELSAIGPDPELAQVHTVLRAAQGVLDSAAYDHSAPFFFSTAEIQHAQQLVQKGFSCVLGDSKLRTRQANLSTIMGVASRNLSDADLIALRRDEDSFEQWRTFRREMSEICFSSDGDDEIREAQEMLTSRWRATLQREKEKDGFVARNLRKDGFLYGAVTAVVTGGGAALTSPVSLPAMMFLVAGGALTGGGMQLAHQWFRTKDERQIRDTARLAFERHLLAVERNSGD